MRLLPAYLLPLCALVAGSRLPAEETDEVARARAVIYRIGGTVRAAERLEPPRYTGVDFSFSAVTDAQLAVLRKLPDLETLNLAGTPIKGEGLAHLKGLGKLSELRLSYTDVDNAAVRHLAGLKALRGLELHRTKVSDQGLASLEQLPELRSLNLSFTAVTDVGLRHLRGASRLETLYLYGPRSATRGLSRYEAARGWRFSSWKPRVSPTMGWLT